MRDNSIALEERSEKRRKLFIFTGFLLTTLAGYLLISVPVSRAGNCRTLDYQKISFEQYSDGQWNVHVVGQTPYINMRVRLIARTYITQPKYWGIDVVGCYPGVIGLPAVGRYNVTLPLYGSMGIKGIEIIGKSKSFKRGL